MTDIDPATLDVASPEHYEQHGYPHPEWTWMRRNDPVHWYDRANVEPFWCITKHADIIKIGKQPELFLNAPRLAVFTKDLPPPEEGTSRHLLNMDPPDHGKYRKVTSHWFTPLSNLTMSPVSGPATLSASTFGAGRPPGALVAVVGVHGPAEAPPSHTRPSRIDVVWLPEWNAAA